ncbi:hypothetical protein Tco_0984792, partial [Tanacetum coccineum]
MSLRTTMLAQQAEIRELQSADRRRQTVIIEMLVADHKRQKMAPKRRTTRLNPETTPAATAATTTTVTNAQLQAMINQGVTVALAARDANTNASTATIQEQPLNFKGSEGVVELTQWIKKMETVFRISNCSVENQIKFSTCTLLGNALT